MRHPNFRTALQPSDISDLLIVSTRPWIRYPRDSRGYPSRRGAHLPGLLPGIHASDHDEDDSSHESKDFLSNRGKGPYIGMALQFPNLFCRADVGGCGSAYITSRRHPLYIPSRRHPLYIEAIAEHFEAWKWYSDSLKLRFAEDLTSDQVVERVLGKPLLRELLRCDLNCQIPFAQISPGDWYQPLAAWLRVAWLITVSRRELEAMFSDLLETVDGPIRTSNNDLWCKTYHRLGPQIRSLDPTS
jgi:hypothetical protein